MKIKVFSLLIILVMMVIIPFWGVKNKVFINIKNENNIASSYTKEDIYGFVSKKFKKEYNTETIKALTVIIQTNYSANNKHKKKNSNNYISEKDFYELYGKASLKYYSKIKKAVDAVYKTEIKVKNKKVYIPYDYIVKKDNANDYPYIKNCATPWDKLKKEYKSLDKKTAVSINTINNLCKSGYSYKDSLKYFLKNIKLTTS